MKEYDLIIIGGGGGLKLLGPALKAKKSVAVIEKDRLGGTCLNRGCIPSKMLIHPADVALEIKNASKFDLSVKSRVGVDFKKLVTRINKTISSDSKGISKRYEASKEIDYYPYEAKFVSDKVLEVNGKKIKGKKIVVAVGARPNVPPIPGLKGTPFWTSSEALKNKNLPKKLIVIGGGYIAVELGHAYSALGSDVHFLVRGRMVAREDSEVIDTFERVFSKEHNVHKEISTDKVEYNKKTKKFTVYYTQCNKHKKKIVGDALLVATGVRPNNDLLRLENTKIKVNKYGYLEVDSNMETNVKGVYGIGDCVGNYLFRHSVNFEGEYLARQLFERGVKKEAIKYPPMPHAIFSNPQVAGVGYTEDELKEKKVPYVVGFNKYIDSAMGTALLEEDGFVKLLFHKKTQKLIGAHIIGPEASDMIHMLIVFMTMRAKIDDLLNIIYIHPALPEIVRNAARKAKKKL